MTVKTPDGSDDAALSPAAADAINGIVPVLSALTPTDAVSVIGALVTRYGWSLTPARALAFIRAVKTSVIALDETVTSTIRKSVKNVEGVYDGYTLTYQPGRRKTDYDLLAEAFPDAYEEAVSVGDPYARISITAKL